MKLSESSLAHVRFAGRPSLPEQPLTDKSLSDNLSQLRTGSRPSRPRLSSESKIHRRHVASPELRELEYRLVRLVFDQFGLEVDDYRSTPLARRLPALLRALRCSSVASALLRVMEEPAACRRAFDTLLIGHTLPFRDAEIFAMLRRDLIPRLARLDRPTRVWSAGCSTGEELLSVAVLLEEVGTLSAATLRGSDCRQSAIEEARRSGSLFAARMKTLEWGGARIAERPSFLNAIDRIEWRVENLRYPDLCSHWDLILCRNVSIYWEPGNSNRYWSRIIAQLAPGGYLVVGKVESPTRVPGLMRIGKCVYQLDPSRAEGRCQ